MGDSKVIDDESEDSKTRPLPRDSQSPKSQSPKSAPRKDGEVASSRHVQVANSAVPPSRGGQDSSGNVPSQRTVLTQGSGGSRRTSSIRPAPASFRPTLRDSSNLPPPMVVHSGDLDENAKVWGSPDVVNHPSQVNVEKPLPSEPFGLAEDLRQGTIPLDFSKSLSDAANSPIVSTATGAATESQTGKVVDHAPDSSNLITQTRNERPVAEAHSESAPPPQTAREEKSSSDTSVTSAQASAASTTKKSGAVAWIAAAAVVGLCGAVFAFGRGKGDPAPNTEQALSASRTIDEAPSNDVQLPAVSSAVTAASPAMASDPSGVPSAPPPAQNNVADAKNGSSEKNDIADTKNGTTAPNVFSPAEIADGNKKDGKPNGKAASSLPVTLVSVKLVPADAKLIFRGVAVPGPPFVIEVPKGRRFAFEASRKGYVTARVTVDSTRQAVTLGLRPDRLR